MTNFIRLFLVFLLATAVASASVCPPIGQPARFNPGDVMRTLDHWNPTVVGVYTWLNTNVVAPLNLLVTKGDLYVYDGAHLQKLAVGTNGHKIVSRSSEQVGVKWESYSGEQPLTTKGDLLYFQDKLVKRLPSGVDGQVLTVSATGVPSWSSALTNPFPVGSIVSWSPAAAGTSTIPSGWALCDGSNGTPNLIGLFVIGTKPNGSSSSASSGGFGAYTADSQHGSNTHIHSGYIASASGGGTGDGSNSQAPIILNGAPNQFGNPGSHYHSIPPFVRSIQTASGEPADYALCYIMKL